MWVRHAVAVADRLLQGPPAARGGSHGLPVAELRIIPQQLARTSRVAPSWKAAMPQVHGAARLLGYVAVN
jgi:hypothetical protein